MQTQFSSTQKRHQSISNRKRLTEDQVRLLEMSFNANQKLELDCKFELARKLGVPPRQVAIWYQNRKARQKVETIEVDNKSIRQQFENIVKEKKRLQQEVGILKHELNKAQHMLLVLSTPSVAFLSPVTTSNDNDPASSSSPTNVVLPAEEIYSFLIDSEGQQEKWCTNDVLVP